MIQVNVRVIGTVGVYKEGMEQVKKIGKTVIQQKVEELHFENKEGQQELKIFIGLLPVVKTIGLSSNKEQRVDIYIASTSFGRKRPEINITKNYPLYKALKKLIE